MSELHEAIADLRERLSDHAEALLTASYDAVGTDASYMTRVAVKAEDAADALFDVLNAAHSYLDDSEAGPAMRLPVEAAA